MNDQGMALLFMLIGWAAVFVAFSPITLPIAFGLYLAAKRKTPTWRMAAIFFVLESAAFAASAWIINYLSKMDF